jgi:hypothetical protein
MFWPLANEKSGGKLYRKHQPTATCPVLSKYSIRILHISVANPQIFRMNSDVDPKTNILAITFFIGVLVPLIDFICTVFCYRACVIDKRFIMKELYISFFSNVLFVIEIPYISSFFNALSGSNHFCSNFNKCRSIRIQEQENDALDTVFAEYPASWIFS